MEIIEMNLEEVESRMAEMNAQLETADAPIDGFEEEMRSLVERKAELAEIEQRKLDAAALNSGEAVPDKFIEIPNKVEEKRMFTPDTVEYREAWLANLMGRPVENEELRSAVTGSAAVIPTETLNKLVARLQENALLSKIDLMQIPGYVRVPVYSTNADASWTTTSTDSADAITYIDLKPYQLIKTVEIGADMDKMSISAFESEVVKILGNKIETALQKAVIVGSGSSQPTGIATTVSSNTGTFTKAAITKKDLMTIMGKLPSDFQKNAVWIMPNSVLYEAMAVADLNGFAGVAAGIGAQIGGKPVIVDDNCVISSTDTIFYGDPSHYRMNIGEGVKVDKDLSLGFRSNSAVYRGVCQADGQLDLSAAFVRYARATA